MERGKCLMCGMCCRAIIVSMPYDDRITACKEQGSDALFIYENWAPIHRDTAFEINPNLPEWAKEGAVFFSCLRYDEETKKCTIQSQEASCVQRVSVV